MANAAVAVSSSGDNSIVSAPGAGKFIRVDGYVLKVKAAVDVKWKSGSTDLTGVMGLNSTDSGIAVSNAVQDGWFDCGINEALVLNLSGAVAVGGHVKYRVMG